jgi:hypothetical protein
VKPTEQRQSAVALGRNSTRKVILRQPGSDKRTRVEAASLARGSSKRTGCRKKWATAVLGASYSGHSEEGKKGGQSRLGRHAAEEKTKKEGGGWWSGA